MSQKFKVNPDLIEKSLYVFCGLDILFTATRLYTNKSGFDSYLFLNIQVLVIIFLGLYVWRRIKKNIKREKQEEILETVKEKELETDIINFINRFGFSKKTKEAWVFEDYCIEWKNLKILRKSLHEKGLTFQGDNWEDFLYLLRHYIEEKDERLIPKKISHHHKNFDKISGAEYEHLLYRLFDKMGYTVQETGITFEHGGDLIANIDNKIRMLIQAKRYTGPHVGIPAVHEALAAQRYYGCNGAMVIICTNFTKEAIEFAKANNVALVNKDRLYELLFQYLEESWT